MRILCGTCVKSETYLHCKSPPVSAGDTLKDFMRIALLVTHFLSTKKLNSKMISLEFSNHIKTFDFKSQRSELEREAIEKVIAGQSLFPLFENHHLTFEEQRQLMKTKLGYPHRGEESSLFLLAVVCGHVDLAKSLIEGKLVDIEEQGTVLVGCCTDDNVKTCSFGYEIGEDVTPLWCAAGWCKFDLVKLLVSNGANINHKSRVGSNPLFMACQYFHSNRARQVLLGKPDVPIQLELVKFLVENGADVGEVGRNGNTPLTVAALSGYKDPSLVVYLLEQGADPNANNSHGSSALHFAAEKGCLETVKELVKHGAQLGVVDAEGLTPLQRACCGCHDEVVEWIISQPDRSREQKIDALELLGASHATLIDIEDIEYPSEGQSEGEGDDDDSTSIQHGYQLMLRATKERFRPPIITKQNVKPPLVLYSNQAESQSLKELEALSMNNEAIRMEGFIIRDRLLGALHTPELLQPLLHKAVVLAHKGDLKMAASFYSHALSYKLVSSLESKEILRRFLVHLACMIETKVHLKIADLEPAYQFISAWLGLLAKKEEHQSVSSFEFQEHKWAFDLDLLLAFYFICILCNVDTPSHEEGKRKLDMVKAIVDLNLQNSQGSDLLHLAVWDSIIEVHNKVSMNEIFRVPNRKVIEILLQCGTDINSQDRAGNSPLHILATVDSKLAIVPKDFKENGGKEYVDFFLRNHAKLDLKNSVGERPVDVAVSEITKGLLQNL